MKIDQFVGSSSRNLGEGHPAVDEEAYGCKRGVEGDASHAERPEAFGRGGMPNFVGRPFGAVVQASAWLANVVTDLGGRVRAGGVAQGTRGNACARQELPAEELRALKRAVADAIGHGAARAAVDLVLLGGEPPVGNPTRDRARKRVFDSLTDDGLPLVGILTANLAAGAAIQAVNSAVVLSEDAVVSDAYCTRLRDHDNSRFQAARAANSAAFEQAITAAYEAARKAACSAVVASFGECDGDPFPIHEHIPLSNFRAYKRAWGSKEGNCYNYATGCFSGTSAEPGRAYGRLLEGDSLRTAVLAGARRDGLERVDSSSELSSSDQRRIVALFFTGEGDPRQDMHWAVKHPDGTWSHKRGAESPENKDGSGRPIVDIKRANMRYRDTRKGRANYTYVGTFSVPQSVRVG